METVVNMIPHNDYGGTIIEFSMTKQYTSRNAFVIEHKLVLHTVNLHFYRRGHWVRFEDDLPMVFYDSSLELALEQAIRFLKIMRGKDIRRQPCLDGATRQG